MNLNAIFLWDGRPVFIDVFSTSAKADLGEVPFKNTTSRIFVLLVQKLVCSVQGHGHTYTCIAAHVRSFEMDNVFSLSLCSVLPWINSVKLVFKLNLLLTLPSLSSPNKVLVASIEEMYRQKSLGMILPFTWDNINSTFSLPFVPWVIVGMELLYYFVDISYLRKLLHSKWWPESTNNIYMSVEMLESHLGREYDYRFHSVSGWFGLLAIHMHSLGSQELNRSFLYDSSRWSEQKWPHVGEDKREWAAIDIYLYICLLSCSGQCPKYIQMRRWKI